MIEKILSLSSLTVFFVVISFGYVSITLILNYNQPLVDFHSLFNLALFSVNLGLSTALVITEWKDL